MAGRRFRQARCVLETGRLLRELGLLLLGVLVGLQGVRAWLAPAPVFEIRRHPTGPGASPEVVRTLFGFGRQRVDLKVLSTVVGPRPRATLVWAGAPVVVGEGDSLGGFVVDSIGRRMVRLRRGEEVLHVGL